MRRILLFWLAIGIFGIAPPASADATLSNCTNHNITVYLYYLSDGVCLLPIPAGGTIGLPACASATRLCTGSQPCKIEGPGLGTTCNNHYILMQGGRYIFTKNGIKESATAVQGSDADQWTAMCDCAQYPSSW